MTGNGFFFFPSKKQPVIYLSGHRAFPYGITIVPAALGEALFPGNSLSQLAPGHTSADSALDYKHPHHESRAHWNKQEVAWHLAEVEAREAFQMEPESGLINSPSSCRPRQASTY